MPTAKFEVFDVEEETCSVCERALEGDPYHLVIGVTTYDLCDTCAPHIRDILVAAGVEVDYPEPVPYVARPRPGWKV